MPLLGSNTGANLVNGSEDIGYNSENLDELELLNEEFKDQRLIDPEAL